MSTSSDSSSTSGAFWLSLLSLGSGIFSTVSYFGLRRTRFALDEMSRSSVRSILSVREELETQAKQYLNTEGASEKSIPTLSLYAEIAGKTACQPNQKPLRSSKGDSAVLIRKIVREVKEKFRQTEKKLTKSDTNEEYTEITWTREIEEMEISKEEAENRNLYIIDSNNNNNPRDQYSSFLLVDREFFHSRDELLWKKVKEEFIESANVRPSMNIEIQLVFGNNTNNNNNSNNHRNREPQVIGHKHQEYIIPLNEHIYALGHIRYDHKNSSSDNTPLILTNESNGGVNENHKRAILLEYGSPNEVRHRYVRTAENYRSHAIWSAAITALGFSIAFALYLKSK